MKLSLLVGILAIAASAHAQDAAPAGSQFPGDQGRPFDGLPMTYGANSKPPWPTRPVAARGPSMEAALKIAQEAVIACKGYQIGVSILDSTGAPKLYFVPDGTAGSHAYTGFRKAYTALTFKKPTSEVGAATKTDPSLAARITADTNYLSFAGGLPIVLNGEVIGAIGVSGAEPSAVDERCAVAGLAKASSLIK